MRRQAGFDLFAHLTEFRPDIDGEVGDGVKHSKKLMVLPHPLNVCSCFNPLCLLHTTLFFINTSIINLTCIIIVTTFLTQSFSAASAVQTDSSFGLKIAFLSLAYNWWVFIQLCNQ